MKKLILAEFVEEVKIFQKYLEREQIQPGGPGAGDWLIISLQPEVAAYCKTQELLYEDTLAFFDNRGHRDTLTCSDLLTRLLDGALMFTVDTLVRQTLMDTFIYYARFYLNNFAWILEVMSGIKEKYEGSEIYTVEGEIGGGSWGGSYGSPFLKTSDCFIPSLVGRFCQRHHISFSIIPRPGHEIKRVDSREKGTSKCMVRRFLKKMARGFIQEEMEKQKAQGVIFITAPSYNLDRLCENVMEKYPGMGAATVLFDEPGIRGLVKLCWQGLRNRWKKEKRPGLYFIPLPLLEDEKKEEEPGIRDCLNESFRAFMQEHGAEFAYKGCSLAPEFSRKVEGGLLVHLDYLHRQARVQQAVLQLLGPQLIMAPVSIGVDESWAELGRAQNIATLVIPQKGLLVPRDEYGRVEQRYIGRAQVTNVFRYAAAQTPLIRNYLEWSGYSGTVIETGNLIFSRVHLSEKERLKSALFTVYDPKIQVIVYAPSMKSRKSRRFYVLETLDELVAGMKDLVNDVSRMPDVLLVIRVHPGEPITRKEIEKLVTLPANVVISDTGTFAGLLTTADLVISYSSTSIQEALINGIPVVLYDKWKRYNHLEAPRFKDPDFPPRNPSVAVYVDEEKALYGAIRWMLDNRESGAINPALFRDYIFPASKYKNFLELVHEFSK